MTALEGSRVARRPIHAIRPDAVLSSTKETLVERSEHVAKAPTGPSRGIDSGDDLLPIA
jgi:hypothetical protein